MARSVGPTTRSISTRRLPAATRESSKPWSRPLALLGIFLVLGGFFRFNNLNWDQYHSFHPDERNILGQTAGIQASDGYRVKFFAYGQLPVYLYRSTCEVVSVPRVVQDSFRRLHLFEGSVTSPLQWGWWVFLLALLIAIPWALSREGWESFTFPISFVGFTAAVVFLLFPVFSSWFGRLDGARLGTAALLFFPASIFAFLAAGRRVLDYEIDEKVIFGIGVAAVALGLVPGLVGIYAPAPVDQIGSAVARTAGQIGYTLLLVSLGAWWSWESRWGRAVIGLLAVWTFIAKLPLAYPNFVDYKYMMVIGRGWAALFSTLTIAAIYLLVKRFYERTSMALVAAGAFAFSVISIQVSHYCITESLITLMCVVVALASWEIALNGTWKSYLLAGAAFGVALAAKSSSLYYVTMIVVGHLAWLARKDAKAWEALDRKIPYSSKFLYSIGAWVIALGTLGAFLTVGWKLKGIFRDLYFLTPVLGMGLWMALFVVLGVAGFLLAAWGLTEFKVLRAQVPSWIPLAATGGLSFFIFCLLSPWSLLDPIGFMQSMNYEWSVVSLADACYVLQFKDTPRYLYHLRNLVSVDLWWPLGVTAIVGMVWILARFLAGLRTAPSEAPQASRAGSPKTQEEPTQASFLPVPFFRGRRFTFTTADAILLAWFASYFGFIGMWNTKFIRYMVPLIPFFCVFAAKVIFDLTPKFKTQAQKAVRTVLVALVLGGSLFYSTAYMAVYDHPHPWIDASVWIYKNITPNTFILTEHWDDGLPTGVDPDQDPRVDKTFSPGIYRQDSVPSYEMFGFPTDDSIVKKNNFADMVEKGDYLTIASKKLWYTLTDCTPEFRPNGFNKYSVTSRYYRLLWSGQLGYKLVQDFHNFPRLFGWVHPDDTSEESFSVYDHPRSYIFKKVAIIPRERILALLSSDDYVKGINRANMEKVSPENVDAFIAEQQKRIEASGALAKLDAVATAQPTPTPGAKAVAPARPVPMDRLGHKPSAAVPSTAETPTPPAVQAPDGVPGPLSAGETSILKSLSQNPMVEGEPSADAKPPAESLGYQVRAWFSWVALLVVLGWVSLPWVLRLMPGLGAGSYALSKIAGMLLFSWLIWLSGNVGIPFITQSCWGWILILAGASVFTVLSDRKSLSQAVSRFGGSWLYQEGVFLLAFALFTLVRIHNPHVHDPMGEGYSGGGEAGMDYGFLASVVRGTSFPAQNMWMAGQPIGYSFYYGHLLMGVLTKTLGLAPEVTYNLAIITLFALIFTGAFGLAYGLSGRRGGGWIAGFLCAAAGNLAGAQQFFKYIADGIARRSLGSNLLDFFRIQGGFTFDYFGASRVIPNSINEFPYFSVLFADMHAHTLAMPFAILFIGLAASLYLAKPVFGADNNWNLPLGLFAGLAAFMAVAEVALRHHPLPLALAFGAAIVGFLYVLMARAKEDRPTVERILALGFVFGSLGFLNTWELPVWGVFLSIVLVARNLTGLKEKALVPGFKTALAALAGAMLLMGWVGNALYRGESLVLGGDTKVLAGCLGLAALVTLIVTLLKKNMRPLGFRLGQTGSLLILFGAFAFTAWIPYFTGFVPQQNEVLWVWPKLRTSLDNLWTIHGAFLSVILVGFLATYGPETLAWISASPARGRRNARRGDWLDAGLDLIEKLRSALVEPQGAVGSLMALGVGVLVLTVGASWVHHTDTAKAWAPWLALAFATIAAVTLALAVYLKDRLWAWTAFAGAVLVWFSMMVVGLLQLRGGGVDETPLLGLWVHAGLLLLGFFNLGLAVKSRSDRPLSFTYLLGAMFFLVLAVLEILVMKEYLGGDWMRNNSLFKYLYCAWLLASVTAGSLLPRLWDEVQGWLKLRRESLQARTWLLAATAVFLWLFLVTLFREFAPFLDNWMVYSLNLVLAASLFGWMVVDGRWSVLGASVPGIPLLLLLALPFLQDVAPASYLGLLGRQAGAFGAAFLFPSFVVIGAVLALEFIGNRQPGLGRRSFIMSWKALLVLMLALTAVYPLAGSWRKCHDFLPKWREERMGYKESPTLDGLSFIRHGDPYDAAAIRFLNEKVPGQPCLIETVGIGYNTWGSRFSIFTGIPALMGWDGHVGEWVGSTQSDNIRKRYNATEEIFNTPDRERARQLLRAYGVNLIVVGPLERGILDSRKGYSPAGLAKFEGWLPVIYKNPGVSIYYFDPAQSPPTSGV